MAYQVNFTDSVNKGNITVEENSPNTETSLTLVGRNLSDYGRIVNENFLHQLENFASSTAPRNPIEGQLWYDTTSGVDQLKIYDGAAWVSAGGLNKSNTQPSAEVSTIGDLWIDTSNQQLYLYSGSGWILVGPDYSEGASTGTRFENITSTSNLANPVITSYVNDVPIMIISQNEFRPKAVIDGFGIIKPGVNISTIGKFYGIAEKAESLIVGGASIPASDFARLSRQNIFEQSLRIRNNVGVSIGETETFSIGVSGSNVSLVNKSTDGFMDLRVANTTTGIRVTNEGKVGVNNISPQSALDVSGEIKSSGGIVVTDVTDSTDISDGSIVTSGGLAVAKNLNIGGNLNVSGSLNISSITPQSADQSIGTATNPFSTVYAANIIASNLSGYLEGDISGSSTSAGKLNSPTIFRITGDISSNEDVSFDGQTGGNVKEFNVTLNDTFFTNRNEYTDDISRTERVLLYKTNSASSDTLEINDFYTTTVDKLVSVVPSFKLGMIITYAGSDAPDGWHICDGSRYPRNGDYADLFAIIGDSYGSDTPSDFYLPDLRGRFALGYMQNLPQDDLINDEDRVYNDPQANILGGKGGAQRRWITMNQLPQHEHYLSGDEGTQFFAITNVTGVSDTDSLSSSLIGGTAGTGITITGGIKDTTVTLRDVPGFADPQEVGEKRLQVPPFVTVNYIIYTGVTS